MFESVGKSLSTIVEERLSSPLISSFAIAWSLWNYKFFVILFSNNTALETFRLIEQVRFSSFELLAWNGVIAPLLLTAFYIYVLPYPSRYVYDRWSKTQKETKDIKQRYEDMKLLNPADAQTLRLELRESQRQVEVAETEVRKLKAELRQSDQKIREFEEALSTSDSKLTDSLRTAEIRGDAVSQLQKENVALKAKVIDAAKETAVVKENSKELEETLIEMGRLSDTATLNELQETMLLTIAEGGPADESILAERFSPIESFQPAVHLLVSRRLATRTQTKEGSVIIDITEKGLAYLLQKSMLNLEQTRYLLDRKFHRKDD